MKLIIFNYQSKERGQSLVEVAIALLVAMVVLGALAVLITSSLKNAQFAQKQVKATKYAQEAIDQIRVIRDRNEFEFWTAEFSSTPCIADQPGRYFILNPTAPYLTEICDISQVYSNLNDGGLRRLILMTDRSSDPDYRVEKTVTVKVKWADSSGEHESELQTIISKL